MKLSRQPHKAKAHGSKDTKREAWWYENAKSIDVYVYDPTVQGGSRSCRIRRAELEDWLKRTAS